MENLKNSMNYAPPAIMRSKKRYLIYALVGFVFGIIDWFYLNWFPEAVGNIFGETIIVVPIIIFLNYSIWLVPIIPVVYFESKYFEKIRFPIIAGIFTWCFALLGYYVYYFILFLLGKLPHLEGLSVFAEKNESFWVDYWQMFRRIILNQLIEWIPIAFVGGVLIAVIVHWFVKRRKNSVL